MSENLSEMALLDRYMQAVGRAALLSEKEEFALAEKARRGDKAARDKMILANLRLVVKIAYDYSHMGVPLLDLISEGTLGLIKAIDRFRSNRGGRLATYAAWWIRQNVKKALADQGKLIRLPLHVVEKIARLRRATSELTASLKREPTLAELAKASHLSQKRIISLREILASTISLDAPVTAAGSIPLEETLSDEKTIDPLRQLLQKTASERINAALSRLEERSAAVLRYRHGLGGIPPLTLDKIGEVLGLTRERVRQIETEAQVQLRRLLTSDDETLSRKEVSAQTKERKRVEVLREFMIEKGLLP